MVFLDEQMWCVRNLFKGKQNVVNAVTFLTNNDRSLGHYQDIFLCATTYSRHILYILYTKDHPSWLSGMNKWRQMACFALLLTPDLYFVHGYCFCSSYSIYVLSIYLFLCILNNLMISPSKSVSRWVDPIYVFWCAWVYITTSTTALEVESPF